MRGLAVVVVVLATIVLVGEASDIPHDSKLLGDTSTTRDGVRAFITELEGGASNSISKQGGIVLVQAVAARLETLLKSEKVTGVEILQEALTAMRKAEGIEEVPSGSAKGIEVVPAPKQKNSPKQNNSKYGTKNGMGPNYKALLYFDTVPKLFVKIMWVFDAFASLVAPNPAMLDTLLNPQNKAAGHAMGCCSMEGRNMWDPCMKPEGSEWRKIHNNHKQPKAVQQCIDYETQINPSKPKARSQLSWDLGDRGPLLPRQKKNTNRALLGFVRRRRRKYAGPLKNDGAVCRDNHECKSNMCDGNKFGTRDGKCKIRKIHAAKAKVKSKVKAGLQGMIVDALVKMEEKVTKGKCKAFIEMFSKTYLASTSFAAAWSKTFNSATDFYSPAVQGCRRGAYVHLMLALKINPCVTDCAYTGIAQASIDTNFKHSISYDVGLGAETPIPAAEDRSTYWEMYQNKPWLVPKVLEDAAARKWGPRCKSEPGVIRRPPQESDRSSGHRQEEIKDGILSVRCNPTAFEESMQHVTAIAKKDQYCLAFGPQCTPLAPVHPVVNVPWAALDINRFLIHKRTRYEIKIMNNGFYRRNEKELKLIPKDNVVCEAAFNFAFSACRSCCCPTGLANVYLASTLSPLNITAPDIELAGGQKMHHPEDAFRCREWFTMLDTFVRATLNLARTGALLARLKAPAWPYSQECSTAKKCKEYMKANPEREKPGHCTCLELKGTKTSHNLALS